jgi:hypothetical protein
VGVGLPGLVPDGWLSEGSRESLALGLPRSSLGFCAASTLGCSRVEGVVEQLTFVWAAMKAHFPAGARGSRPRKDLRDGRAPGRLGVFLRSVDSGSERVEGVAE